MNDIGITLAALWGWPLLILAIGIYSITRLITTDSFPPIEKLRIWVFEHFPHEGFTTRKRPNPKRATFHTVGDRWFVSKGHWLGELISCNWCAGWWVSICVCAAFWFWPIITTAVLVPFALRVCPGILAGLEHFFTR